MTEKPADKAQELLDRFHNLQSVREFLAADEADEEKRNALMEEVKKIYYTKRRKRGTGVLLAGCVLLLIGFCCTVLLFHNNNSFNVIMYSFTGIGILAVLAGLADIVAL